MANGKDYEGNKDRADRLDRTGTTIRRPHESGVAKVVRPKSERPKPKPVVRRPA